MKRYSLILLAYGCVLAAVMLLLPGCASAPLDPLVRAVEAALTDGVVTSEELAVIESHMPSRFDWGEAAMIGGSILGSLLGIKILPNSVLRGPWDKPQPPLPPAS